MRLAQGLALLGGLVLTAPAVAGPHPFHDDHGNINWRPNWQVAVQQAQKGGKPLFIEICNDGDGTCRSFAGGTLRDSIVGLTLNRHFVSAVIASDKVPPELKGYMDKADGQGLPCLLLLSDRGDYILGMKGQREAKKFQADLEEVLKNKAFAMSKSKEADLTRQVAALEKALDAKDYKKAVSTFQNIQQVSGYSTLKDRADDLMDKAQEEGANVLRKALDLARKNDYTGAKDAFKEFPTKAMTGLPVAVEARDHQAAFKLLEAGEQAMTDKKGNNWKAFALTQFDTLLAKYSETPYATLAMVYRKDLMKQ
jgi:hypothetical protein